MTARFLAAFLLSGSAALLAQAPAAAPTPQVHTSELGFAYSVPSDWEVVDSSATLPKVQQQVTQSATSEDEKKGIACAQVALTARHGSPASVVVVVALPFDCFGQQMAESDLAGFASGASEGLKKSFEITDPSHITYSLGAHNMWIERAKGTPIGHPEMAYTIETVCTILKKGAVCWMAMASVESELQTFERGAVTLDGADSAVLVPADVFAKKP
jgi:hypothetical protein